jgi:signal transduction histidine kinase
MRGQAIGWAVVAGGLALAGALAVAIQELAVVFAAERADLERSIQTEAAGYESAILRLLERKLHRRLVDRRPQIEAALLDPRVPDTGLLWIAGDEQRLPRIDQAHAATATPAASLLLRLEAGRWPLGAPASPWGERLQIAAELLGALDRGDRTVIAERFRALLAHRARHRLPAELAIPVDLALLDRFLARADPAPGLLFGVLREGLFDPAVGRAEALELELLSARASLTAPDFTLLCQRMADLEERARNDPEPLVAACAEREGARVRIPLDLVEPGLVGGWYVEPDDHGVVGIAVDPAAELGEVVAELSALGVVDPELRAALVPGPALALARTTLSLPRWEAAREAAARRYLIKLALLAAVAIAAIAIPILAAIDLARRRRFLALRSGFVAAISHELKTPLAAIRVMAETLEERVAGVAGARDYPARIVREADQLGALVDNVLSWGRIERGRVKLDRVRVRLSDLAPRLEEEARRAAGREVRFDATALAGAEVFADRQLLELLLLNLVRNAAVHNPRPRVEIAISARVGREVVIAVRDNGAGIPSQDRRRIFDDFERGSDAGARKGSGIGLALARRVAQLHGGWIRVANSGPDGTTIEVGL